MKQVDIKIEKTARYFVLGTPSEKITTVWFVCHGYGQLAKYFIKWFEPLQNENTLIIAPEGLNRFYWNGFSGDVVASWMTKEDRQNDIEDYIKYLEKVAHEVLLNLGKIQINILGFSQGTSTVTRWISQGKTIPNNLILWGGSFPNDINYFDNRDLFSQFNLHLVIGDKDEILPEDVIQKELKKLKEKEIKFCLTRYQGGHKILSDPLLELREDLSK